MSSTKNPTQTVRVDGLVTVYPYSKRKGAIVWGARFTPPSPPYERARWGQQQISLYTTDREQAIDRAKNLATDLRRGEWRPRQRIESPLVKQTPTLRELCGDYLRSNRRMAPAAKDNYRRWQRLHVEPAEVVIDGVAMKMIDLPISEIEPYVIQKYVDWLFERSAKVGKVRGSKSAGSLDANSIRAVLSQLSGVFKYAIANGLIRINPVQGHHFPREEYIERTALRSSIEIAAMAMAPGQLDDEAMERFRVGIPSLTTDLPKISELDIHVGTRRGRLTVIEMPRTYRAGKFNVERDPEGRILCYGCGKAIPWKPKTTRDPETGRILKSGGSPPRWCKHCKRDGTYDRRRMAKVQCDCGSEPYYVALPSLAVGDAYSCGCWKKENIALRNEEKSSLWGVRYRHALVNVLLYSGLRPGELRVLRWRNVDFENGFLRVEYAWKAHREEGRPKSHRGVREIELRSALREALLSHLPMVGGKRARPNPDAFVFATKGGKMLSEHHVQRAVDEAAERANAILRSSDLEPIRDHMVPYSLRRTFCTILFAIGEDLDVVMDEMGHDSESVQLTLDVYRQQRKRSKGEKAVVRALIMGETTPREALNLGKSRKIAPEAIFADEVPSRKTLQTS